MNKYEIMFIVKPDVEDEARNKIINNFKAVLTANGGNVDNVNEWGLRDFAYEVQKLKKGYYVILDVTTDGANISEFDRVSRINSNVLRHMVIRK